MRIDVDIEDGKLQNLSANATVEISIVAKSYIEEVLDEASRIEESRRSSTGNPEITSSIITDAVIFSKRFGIKKRKPKKQIAIQIVASFSSLVTGGLFQIDKFTNGLFLFAFLVCFLIAIASSIFLIFNDGTND